MIENCTVYLPSTGVNFQAVFPGGTSDAGPMNKPTRYEYETPQGPVRLNLKYAENDTDHLVGLTSYIKQLENSTAAIDQAIEMVNQVEMFFGVVLPEPVSVESEAFQSLLFLTEQQQGFMFVADSILTANGYIIGPMTYDSDPVETGHADVKQETFEPVPSEVIDRRQENIDELSAHGFSCGDSLPYSRFEVAQTLRPAYEIAGRLFAQMALFMWVAAPEEKATSDGIGKFVADNNLEYMCTESELQILQMDRHEANATHGTQAWRQLENMWALAWVCGFGAEPRFHDGQISGDITRSVLEYLPNLGGTIENFLETCPLRRAADVSKKEDLFCCVTDAVQRSQVGSETVPTGFDPTNDGGAIHGRLKALTWCLSPRLTWSETDR